LKRVLYGVSPIGLGHATRASAVAEEMRSKGVEVVFASGGHAADYLRARGFVVERAVAGAVPAVAGGEMKRASLWYARYWWGYRKTRRTLAALLERCAPDLVVGDEEFAGVSLAIEKRLKHALVTDELELGFARSAPARAIESRVSRWYSRLLSEASVVLIPDFGEDVRNRRHTGPIVRRVTKTRSEVEKEFSLPGGGLMVLLSMSGSGIGGHLLNRTARAVREAGIPGGFLVVSGNRGGRLEEAGAYDLGVVLDNQNLVAAADLVVSTAGKSTIDEAASAGTPIIALPIRNHAEQVRNAAALGYAPGDEERLKVLINDSVGKRVTARDYQGAEEASRILLSMI
jgi:UDP-N-acetylglucosamine--N-acetylmuramyl-(pentapeptide) pyrophosphoryl-undecaprenol N-acetylglucosamine transferase